MNKEKIIDYIEYLESKALQSDTYFKERAELFIENQKLKEKIKKAVEYIKEEYYDNDETWKQDGCIKILNDIQKEHTRLKCKQCGDIIVGDGEGTYITCKCKSIAIDETDYYCRIIGNQEDWEQIEGEDND